MEVIRPTIVSPRIGGLFLVVALLAAACSSGSATTAPTAAPPTQAPATTAPSSGGGGAAGSAVTIKDFSFDPATLTAKVGQEITWTNQGNASHTVTFDSGGVDSGTLASGKTFKHTFAAAGSFTYHCNFHSSMTGTITVTQ
jgi:plastocyanin